MSVSVCPQRIVVVGNGMVGWKFCDRLSAYDGERRFEITVFGEEPRVAYDRVQLSSYFEHRSEEQLTMAPRGWYQERGIALHTATRVVAIDRASKEVETSDGERHGYDVLVLATGSAAFVPPIPGAQTTGVFVYRTLEDLDAIMAYASKKARTCAVLGGGLLGLEAARAVQGCGLQTHVVELAPRLMPRQLDDTGGLASNAMTGSSSARVEVRPRLGPSSATSSNRGRSSCPCITRAPTA